MSDLPPAGWYHDGSGAPVRRWWDGAGWTAHYEQTPQQGLAPLPSAAVARQQELARTTAAGLGLITRQPLPDAGYAPPETTGPYEPPRGAAGIQFVELGNPPAVVGAIMGAVALVAAPVVAMFVPHLPAAVPSVAGLLAFVLGVVGAARARWAGTGRGLSVLAIVLALAALALAAALRAGLLRGLLPALGPIFSVHGF